MPCAILVAVAAFHPHYSAPIQNSIQKWDLPVLREQIRQHHVAKVAFYQDERMVEVLDVNGLQRSVMIFPEATPYLVDDLREAKVSFYVAPQDSVATWKAAETLLVAFATAFVSTLLVLQVLSALGMLWMVLFAMSVMYEGLARYADAVGEGWELTVAEWRAAWNRFAGIELSEQHPQDAALPVLIDDEPSQPEWRAASDERKRASRSRDPSDDF